MSVASSQTNLYWISANFLLYVFFVSWIERSAIFFTAHLSETNELRSRNEQFSGQTITNHCKHSIFFFFSFAGHWCIDCIDVNCMHFYSFLFLFFCLWYVTLQIWQRLFSIFSLLVLTQLTICMTTKKPNTKFWLFCVLVFHVQPCNLSILLLLLLKCLCNNRATELKTNEHQICSILFFVSCACVRVCDLNK